MENKVSKINAAGKVYDINDPQADIDIALLRQDIATERERAELAEQQLQKDKQSVVKVVWNEYAHIDQFITPGIYSITGERLTTNDGLPIANAAPGHTIAGTLTVLSSSIRGTGKDDDKCITQMLVLSNRTGGDGKVYIRTGRASIANMLAGGVGWEPWSQLQQNVEVGEVASYDDLTDNGIYSGVYIGSDSKETFVLVVINDYALATQLGVPRCVSQFKYSLGAGSNVVSYHSRVWNGATWSAWDIINADEINDFVRAEVGKLANVDAGLIKAIQTLAQWMDEHGNEAAEMVVAIQKNSKAITDEAERAKLAEQKNSKAITDEKARAEEVEKQFQQRIEAVENKTMLELPSLDDFVKGKRLDASGNISSFSDCSATEKYFYIPAKTKISVKGRIYAGYTFVCVYDANYKAIHILQGQGSSTDVEYTLEYDYPTYIRISTPTARLNTLSIVCNDINLTTLNNRVTSIENATESLGKPNTLNYEDFEIGNIGIDRTGWAYRDNTDSRVRMKAGITYHLFVGDVVKLPDGVRAYLGYRVGNTYDFKSWVTNEFTIVTEGDYKIMLSWVSESTLSSKYDLLTGVRINGGERRYENTLPIDADALATMRVINHRGFNVEAPENTLPAFELSKLKGFRYVEADIRFTADGVAVCLHDDTVDRTSNGSGSVDAMTLEELRALDFGSWFSADYAGVQIPTFEEFIVLCKQLGLKPYIELKAGTAEQIKQLFDLVRLYGMEKHSTFISFNLSLLLMLIDNSDKVRIGLLADTYSEEYLNKLISLKGDKRDVFAALNGNAINDEVIMTIRQNGCDVETYTAPWSGFILKVDGVTTDGKMYWDYSGSCSVWRSKTNGWKE